MTRRYCSPCIPMPVPPARVPQFPPAIPELPLCSRRPDRSAQSMAEFSTLKSSAEMACACACETLLLGLVPPRLIKRSENKRRDGTRHPALEFRCMNIPPANSSAAVAAAVRRSCCPPRSSNAETIFPRLVFPSNFIFCTACATLTRAVLDNHCIAVLNRDFATKFQP